LSHHVTFLGYEIDTCQLTVTWPFERQHHLHDQISEILQAFCSTGHVHCKLLAQALGLLQNGCFVLPLGASLSLQLQHAFNDRVALALSSPRSPWHQHLFWDTAVICLTTGIVSDLKALASLLAIHHPNSRAWSCPIGLLIPRVPHFTCLSNASYEGLGGWSPQLCLMWCITASELWSLSFSIIAGSEPSLLDPPDALHINTLEFIAFTVSMWLALSFCTKADPHCGRDHIGNFLADNTSVLLWMWHAGQAHTPQSHRLAHFLQALLTFTPLSFQFQSRHISGQLNTMADLLLHPSRARSWASIITCCPQDLLPCKPYLVPCKLLSALHNCIANNETTATSAGKMITQSIPMPHTSPDGWQRWDTTNGLYS